MNIAKLIEAAKIIDHQASVQDKRVEEWRTLAADARKPDADQEDIARRKKRLDNEGVVDFSGSVAMLRSALRAAPDKKKAT